MKIIHLILLFCIVLNFQLGSKEDKKLTPIAELGGKLEKEFGQMFVVSYLDRCILLKSKKEFKYIGTLSWPEGGPTKEQIEKFAIRCFYEIRLTFDIKISQDGINALYKFKKEFEAIETSQPDIINSKRPTAAIMIPKYYFKDMCVYVFRSSYEYTQEIIGEEDQKLVDAVYNFLGKSLNKYDTPEN